RVQRIISVTALAAALAASLGLLFAADAGPIVVEVGSWAVPVGIDLVADRISAVMLTVSFVMLLCVLLYSLGQGVPEGEDDPGTTRGDMIPVAIFHPTFLI